MSENKERMLPGDWSRKVKYDALDNTKKKVNRPDGFFTFPEAMKGVQETKQKDFLVFYFSDNEQYKVVREFFDLKSKGKLSHPKLDSVKLFELVSQSKKNEK